MRFFLIFKVHGAGCPAGRAGLQKDDAIILVNEKDVISLKHNEFVQLIKSLSVMKLTMVVERFVPCRVSSFKFFDIKEGEY